MRDFLHIQLSGEVRARKYKTWVYISMRLGIFLFCARSSIICCCRENPQTRFTQIITVLRRVKPSFHIHTCHLYVHVHHVLIL